MPIIDGEPFSSQGSIGFEKGSGDSKETCKFEVVRGPDRRLHWLLVDEGKWWMYGLAETSDQVTAGSLKTVKVHENFKGGVSIPTKWEDRTIPEGLQWVSLATTVPGATDLYRESTDALIVGEGSSAWVLPGIPLAKYDSFYYSPTFSATEVVRSPVGLEPTSGMTDLKGAGVLALVMGAALAMCAAAGIVFPVKLLWIIAPVFGLLSLGSRKVTPSGRLARLVAGGFFLHMVTRAVDVAVTGGWEDAAGWLFEEWKLAAVFLVLGVLTRLWPQVYFGLLDGAYRAGYFVLVVALPVMAVVSHDDEFNYFPWFNYYLGAMPWGALVLLLGVASLLHSLADYRHVPVDRRGFRSLLYRVIDSLGQAPDVAAQRSKRLARWGDDLEDAVSISCDRQVLSLSALGPDFLLWKKQAESLSDYQQFTPEQQERVKQDLAAICQDFQETANGLDKLPDSRVAFGSLRFSPFLVTWNQ